jgi:hypothetical protein
MHTVSKPGYGIVRTLFRCKHFPVTNNRAQDAVVIVSHRLPLTIKIRRDQLQASTQFVIYEPHSFLIKLMNNRQADDSKGGRIGWGKILNYGCMGPGTWAGRALRLLLAAGAYRSEARNAPTPCDLGWSRASLAARSRCVPQRSEERTDTMRPGHHGWVQMKKVQKDPRLSAYIRSFIFQAW